MPILEMLGYYLPDFFPEKGGGVPKLRHMFCAQKIPQRGTESTADSTRFLGKEKCIFWSKNTIIVYIAPLGPCVALLIHFQPG